MIRTCASAAVLCFALAGCGLGTKYPTFGESAYRIDGTATTPDGAAPISTVIYRDHAKMRVETVLPGRGPATIVFDDATKAAYVITAVGAPAPAGATTTNVATIAPANTSVQPQAQPQPAAPAGNSPTGYAGAVLQSAPTVSAAPAAAAAPAPTVAAAPAPANAVGVAVRLGEKDAPTPMEQPWQALTEKNARTTGACNVAGEAGRLWTPRTAEAGQLPRTACITDDGIVLQVQENGVALWQATKVERGAQNANLFGIPAGYAIVDPEAVAETVSETLNEIGSVAGDAKTPVTTAKR